MAVAQLPANACARLLGLPGRLAAQDGFVAAVDSLRKGEGASLDAVWGSSRALAAAALADACPGVLLVVCSRPEDVDRLCDDLGLFTDRPVERFEAREVEPGDELLLDEVYGDRLRLLKLLVERQAAADSQPADAPRAPLVVASIQSLLQSVPTPQALRDSTRTLRVGQRLAVDELLKWLVEHGFQNTSAVELPGEFAVRGGIIDLFAPDWFDPVRIELFGDEIESIRRFDVAAQRSLASLDAVEVTVLTAADQGGDHLASFLPEGSWTLLVEPREIEDQAKQFRDRTDHPESLHETKEVFARLRRFSIATGEAVAEAVSETGDSAAGGVVSFRMPVESVEQFSGDVHKVRQELDLVGRGQEVLVVCQTDAEIKRLDEVFHDAQIATQGRLSFVVGRLHGGFRFLSEQVVLVSGDELFHRADVNRTIRRRLGRAIDSFLDLREGDLIVHLAHGIGRYRGLKVLTKHEQAEEHLELEFDGATKIYVPASKINLVQKYVGGTKSRPSLAKIGGRTWLRQKESAERAVVDLAAEMLELQASRESRPGIIFPPDSAWQQEFDASFAYQETPDQLTAIESIKGDMHRARPMDRLLCGDVGFGKTELAVRAAFKAVDSGFQVALLAPTTILVEQHFRTLGARMAEYPFSIARLSRFLSTRDQNAVIRGLAAGSIDIVVGTHRLASKDVTFKNLGLLIIDEEQRFGVEVKERLKALRETVDVLTMTATPIPRTLHMSLLGLRDISSLETPPGDRIAVETRVARWDAQTIRHAVLRELARGGQIFFVHNRIADILLVEQKLRTIVPEASIAVGHGQMPEDELERVMLEFVDRKYDILLSTTIIESGLDIPNANTIFIDEADRYGLADLHQLRGRVGRYKHRAYCYLLVDPAKYLTPSATRRLRAIEEFSRLGSGFAIAMRDLEIRGAGNILGTQQSGHIAAVGYDLYCQLLEQAVRRLKQLAPREVWDVNIDLPVSAFVPRTYVNDLRQKIDLYRRLRRIGTEADLADFRAELTDRFGHPPVEVERLLALAELRTWAGQWKIDAIYLEGEYLVLRYRDASRIEALAARSGRRLRVVDERSAYLPLPKPVPDGEGLLSLAQTLLRPDTPRGLDG